MVLEDIKKAKSIINDEKEAYCGTIESYFSKIYPISTENLSGYLKQFSFENKEVLTTGSSADQVLNLINYGATQIDHFDINPFVKYYFSLKRAGILHLNHKKYLDFFYGRKVSSRRLVLNEKTYQKLSSNLDNDSRLFWDSLYNLYKPCQIREKLFFIETMDCDNYTINNEYLNKNNYTLMRKRIDNCHINFINTNIVKLPCDKAQYDFVLLSNIFDYLYNLIVLDEYEFPDVLFAYRSRLMKLTNLLKEDGIMFFHYFWKVNENMVYDIISNFMCGDPHISTIFFESVRRKSSFERDGLNNSKDGVMIYTKTNKNG